MGTCVILSGALAHVDPRIEWATQSISKNHNVKILAFSSCYGYSGYSHHAQMDRHSIYKNFDVKGIDLNETVNSGWPHFYFMVQLGSLLFLTKEKMKISLKSKIEHYFRKLKISKKAPTLPPKLTIEDSEWDYLYQSFVTYDKEHKLYQAIKTHFENAFFYLHDALLKFKKAPTHIYCADLDTLLVGVVYKINNPNTQLIYDAHEIYSESANSASEKFKEFFKLYESKLIPFIDTFITVSPQIKEYYRKLFPTEKVIEQGLVIPNAPPYEDRFTETSKKNQQETVTTTKGSLSAYIKFMRDYLDQLEKENEHYVSTETITIFKCDRKKVESLLENKYDVGRVNFLLQGNISAGRGFESFIKAWNELNLDSANLLIRGPISDEYKKELSQLADKTLDQSLYFLPPVAERDLIFYASLADVGIIPYPPTSLNQKYCSPNKLGQYMHAELAILACKTEFVEQVVTKSQSGLLYEMDNIEQIKESILSFIENSEQRFKFKENAKNYAKHSFNWNAFEESF